MVGTFLVHYEANVSPRRGDAEQVGRRYKRTFIMLIMIISPLSQLVGVFDETVLTKNGLARRGGGQREGVRTPKPQQDYEVGGESGRKHGMLHGCALNLLIPAPSAEKGLSAIIFHLPGTRLLLACPHRGAPAHARSKTLAMMARRVLVLACLFLVVAPLQSVSGQDGGLAEAEKLDLDEVLDSLPDAGGGVAEVSL